MQINQLKKVAEQLIHKGMNHKGENCYLAFIGDLVIDVIENKSTGIVEIPTLDFREPEGGDQRTKRQYRIINSNRNIRKPLVLNTK